MDADTNISYENFKYTVVVTQPTYIYTRDGKQTLITIPNGSVYRVNEKKIIDGTEYYHIDNNSWIISTAANLFANEPSRVSTNSVCNEYLLNIDGTKVERKGLIGAGDWIIDSVVNVDDNVYYQIGNGKCIDSKEAIPYSLVFGFIEVDAGTRVYNDSGLSTRKILKETKEKYDRLVNINKILMYRIGNNEYIDVPGGEQYNT